MAARHTGRHSLEKKVTVKRTENRIDSGQKASEGIPAITSTKADTSVSRLLALKCPSE